MNVSTPDLIQASPLFIKLLGWEAQRTEENPEGLADAPGQMSCQCRHEGVEVVTVLAVTFDLIHYLTFPLFGDPCFMIRESTESRSSVIDQFVIMK